MELSHERELEFQIQHLYFPILHNFLYRQRSSSGTLIQLRWTDTGNPSCPVQKSNLIQCNNTLAPLLTRTHSSHAVMCPVFPVLLHISPTLTLSLFCACKLCEVLPLVPYWHICCSFVNRVVTVTVIPLDCCCSNLISLPFLILSLFTSLYYPVQVSHPFLLVL